ncbi:hypothetical protein ZHAS_00016090 [Anopheles sinensis]|uniref:Uncharacterized protein n=1 Tax=Anopheles sinensis TaxID=74873 RepID=A0A084WD20_ANOSI|nr:hypothetical protein ZHAS_00016090 [Anopheles sinensis]
MPCVNGKSDDDCWHVTAAAAECPEGLCTSSWAACCTCFPPPAPSEPVPSGTVTSHYESSGPIRMGKDLQ